MASSHPGSSLSAKGANGPSFDSFGELLYGPSTVVLGYRRFGARGGEVGAMVCDQLQVGQGFDADFHRDFPVPSGTSR